jgi:hypothetical protein
LQPLLFYCHSFIWWVQLWRLKKSMYEFLFEAQFFLMYFNFFYDFTIRFYDPSLFCIFCANLGLSTPFFFFGIFVWNDWYILFQFKKQNKPDQILSCLKKYCLVLQYQLYLSIRLLDQAEIIRGVSMHIVIFQVQSLERPCSIFRILFPEVIFLYSFFRLDFFQFHHLTISLLRIELHNLFWFVLFKVIIVSWPESWI